MQLSYDDIIDQIAYGHIIIPGLNKKDIQPASIDVHVSKKALIPIKREECVSLNGDPQEYDEINDDNIVIKPREFVLLSTIEKITIDNTLVGFINGKSTTARLGLSIEEASMLQPGFSGNVTLEVFNHSTNTIILNYKDPIAQVYFQKLSTPSSKVYTGKYQNQEDTTKPIV